MKSREFIIEVKKAEAPKPRNFVAKNAKMGGAGQHKDKKKAEKQGDMKHKKQAELSEVSLGDYRKKAAMQKAQSQMGAMFARDPEQKAKDLATFNKRERGLNRLKARDTKSRADAQAKQLADLVARLPELKAEYEAMKAEYKSLGGSDWQYADREQNLSNAERQARDMEGPMNNLWRQIQSAEKAQKSQGTAEAVTIDRSKNPSYPNDPATVNHRLDTAKAILSDPNSDPDSRRAAAAIIAKSKQGVAEGGNEYEQRQKLIKYIAQKKGWDVSDLELAKTTELVLMYKKIKDQDVNEAYIQELSSDLLAAYKKKAGEQASAADKAGDYEKGNKRFKGINKATNKQFDNDVKKHK
jgi:hypothetical protein